MLADGSVVIPADLRDLTVVDRGCSMYRTQTVTPVSDSGRGGQVGVVMAVSTELDLIRMPQNDGDVDAAAVLIARGVSPCELRRVTGLCLGDLVVSGPWLGRVVEVHVDVDVAFGGGGAVCHVDVDGRMDPEQDFFPGERVVDVRFDGVDDDDDDAIAADDEDADTATSEEQLDTERFGVVRSFNCKDRTVCVSWFKPAEPGEEEPSWEVEGEDETVSAYHLDKYDYNNDMFYGYIVVRLPSTESNGGDGESTQGYSKEGAAADLSWVGHVTDLCDGHVQVKWGDGSTSKVLHHEIDFLKLRDISELEQEILNGNMAQKEDPPQDPEANDANAAAMSDNIEGDTNSADGSDEEDAGVEGGSDEEGSVKKVDAAADYGDGDSFRFMKFDVIQSPSDHHYLDNMEQGTGGGTKGLKRVQKEWKVLENNLPDTIYVRAFEDRMDLLRAAMVGAAGTPYQDGLFFFDLQLPPSSYPAEPPLVYYRSFGLRVNPNLYPSGKVCLSLLGTFGGEDAAELWSPAKSTVLQVVVSIQALVLTAPPYYNEPGNKGMGTHNVLPYAENAYTCSRYGPCSTCCAGRRRGSTSSSEHTSAAAASSCCGGARPTCGKMAAARLTPMSGRAPRGSSSRSPVSCRGLLRPSPT
ncbi:hypothetical protein EJB05_33680, partial [Eragrostis curvula]